MKIAFIGDCKGRVHYNRYKSMSKCMDIVFNFFTVKSKNLSKKCARYDAVYYASYTMYKRQPIKHPAIYGSATSWKCIFGNDHKRDISILPKFKAISVNNLALTKELKQYREDVQYIPNGVDTSFFRYFDKKMNNPLIIGWVGNYDRAEKNYHIIKRLQRKYHDVIFKTVITSKSTPSRKLLSRKEMRDFYYSLDYLLVVSSYEGTPNPALEAAACGIPIITTPVGNMPEIITEGETGFFVYSKTDVIRKSLHSLSCISSKKYNDMSNRISKVMVAWDWSSVCKKFEKFFI